MKYKSTFLFLCTVLAIFVGSFVSVAQVANDNCANATMLQVGIDSVCIVGSNVGATASTDAPLPSGSETGYNGGDVWFSFVAPESGRVIIRTGSTDDPSTVTEGGMALYSGNCGPTLTQLALSTSGLGGSFMPRIDTDDEAVVLVEGNTYYIRFWSFDNFEQGSFNICIWTIPVVAGNTCEEATHLNVGFECLYRQFHNLLATPSSVSNPPCGNYNSGSTSTGDVWFSMIVPPSGHLVVNTAKGDASPALTDCAMAMYSGSCSSLTMIECVDDPEYGVPMPKIERTDLTPGDTVYVRVWDRMCNDRGHFKICAYTPPPINDECENAITLDAPFGTMCFCETTYTNYGATGSTGIPNPTCGNYLGGDVWFKVEAQLGQRLVIRTQEGDITNAGLAIYRGDCSSLNLLQCVTGSMPETSVQGLDATQDLYIRFWAEGNSQAGSFGICAYHTDEIGVNMGETNVVYSTCDPNDPLIICDDGGTDNYGLNRDDTLTIYSQDDTQGFIKLKFLEVDIHPDDTLFVYNGNSASPEFLTYAFGSQQVSWINNSNHVEVGDETGLTVTAFWPNASGAITLRFKTGSTGEGGTGFRLKTYCTVLCQPIDLNVGTMNQSITFTQTGDPIAVHSESDGYTYINLCPQVPPHDTITEQVTFNGVVNFPYSDQFYHQDNSNTLFKWKVGTEEFVGYGLSQITSTFKAGEGTEVKLSVIDTVGCVASNIASYRVRASQNPIFNMDALVSNSVTCSGEPILVTFGYDDASVILDPIGGQQESSLSVSDTIFLPDGNDCPPYGNLYRSPVTFDAFSANDYIESVEDILSVCLNIEHSYVGDIRISLECPNGQSVILLPDYRGSLGWPNQGQGKTGAYFGEPYGGTGHSAYDQTSSCDPALNPHGVGWNYCFSENTTSGYVYPNTQNGYIYQSALQYNVAIDSTNVASMDPVYKPLQSFEGLIGCPMNGTWFIEVEDSWRIDNGYIFGWSLNLAPRLMPDAWEYEVDITQVTPDGPYINTSLGTDTSFVIDPPIGTPSGSYEYSFTIVDEYNCVFSSDSSVFISIYDTYPEEDPVVYTDDVCAGIPYNNYGFEVPVPTGSVSAQDTTITFIKQGLHTVVNGCDSTVALHLTVHPSTETNINASICQGESYTQNGFNVSGDLPGNFIHRNVLLNQHGCDSVVSLFLEVLPKPDVSIFGILDICQGASTTLTAAGGTPTSTYLWSTGETTMSITVTPDQDSDYWVTVSNLEDCSNSDTVRVMVSNSPTPIIDIEGNTNIICGDGTTLTVVGSNLEGVTYQWQYNGTIIEGETSNSIEVNPTTTSLYSVTVTSPHDCVAVSDATVTVAPLQVSINATQQTITYGETTTLSVSASNAASYLWTWSGGNSATTPTITVSPELPTTYHVTVTTEEGCTASAQIEINIEYSYVAPDSVNTEFLEDVQISVSCQSVISWIAPDSSELKKGGNFLGYNIYRDDVLLNTNGPIQADSLVDIELPEGYYTYCVSCVYANAYYPTGIESDRVCSSINFVATYNAPTVIFSTRTEECDASLLWDTPDRNCWADLEGFYIYRENKLIDSILKDGTVDTIYVDKNIGEDQFEYCIQAFYKDANDITRTSELICKTVNTCYYVALNIYPNPADKSLTVIANQMDYINIYDQSGRLVQQVKVPDNNCRTINISTEHFAAGIYTFRVYIKGSYAIDKKVLITH